MAGPRCPACGTADLTNGRLICSACSFLRRPITQITQPPEPVQSALASFSDLIAAELEQERPVPPRVLKVLDTAEANGWVLNGKGCTIVVRLDKPGDEQAVPMFVSWQLVTAKDTGKRSWRFAGARAANSQPMNFNDVLDVLQDPSLIHPEPETESE